MPGPTPAPAPYLLLPLLVAVAFTVVRSALSLGAQASDAATLAAVASAPEGPAFELRGCSISEVASLPAAPSSGSIYLYAEDLYETYTALCGGRAAQ
jgi:hypothetical protein